MIDRFGREIDDDVKINFEDGGEVRLHDRNGGFHSKGPLVSESFHSEYFKKKETSAKARFAEKSRQHSIVVGIACAIALIFYGMLFNDVPVIYLSIAFISYVFAPFVGKLTKPAVERAIKAFSITTFIGALILAAF